MTLLEDIVIPTHNKDERKSWWVIGSVIVVGTGKNDHMQVEKWLKTLRNVKKTDHDDS